MTALATRPSDRSTSFGLLRAAALQWRAISPEARAVRERAQQVARSGEESVALFGAKQAALAQLSDLVRESREQAEHEDQQPVSHAAAAWARAFILALPDNVPLPELAAEPDGSISLDWIRSRTRMVSVIVEATAGLPYAWIDGAERGRGVADFDGVTVPSRLLADIRRIMQ